MDTTSFQPTNENILKIPYFFQQQIRKHGHKILATCVKYCLMSPPLGAWSMSYQALLLKQISQQDDDSFFLIYNPCGNP